MPPVIRPKVNFSRKHAYQYPKGLNLDPSKEKHRFILDRLFPMILESQSIISTKYEMWRKIDQSLTTYVRLDDSEIETKNNDYRKPVSVVVPVNYAVLDTVLSYFSSTFLNQPFFKYSETSSEDIIKAMLLEHVVAQQSIRAKAGLDLHTHWRDGISYGIGILAVNWTEKWAYRTNRKDQNVFSKLLGELMPGFQQPSNFMERVKSYEGNELIAIDPYNFLPDPSVSIDRVQDMQYAGWIERTNMISLLELEKNSDGEIFNAKYVNDMRDAKSQFFRTDRTNDKIQVQGESINRNVVDIITLYVKLIPKEWKLGTEEYPETWMFQIAGDGVIIRAQPLGYDHDMIPIAVFAPEYDGHTATPISKLEVTYGMQETLDWLFSSHIKNVSKAINDMLIVDPFLVNIADLADPRPGKLIRMRRAAWGRGVKDAVQQLNVVDVTKGNINDAGFLIDLISRTSGANDILQGIMRTSGERRSATEARDAKLGAINRIAKSAKIASMQSHYDIAYMFASNTRQLMEKETFVRFIGENAEILKETYGGKPGTLVSPTDIDLNFDIVVNDGAIEAESVDTWMRIFEIAATQPAIQQRVDLFKIFKHVGKLAGAKGLEHFEINTSVQQPEQIDREVQKGNMIPMDEMPPEMMQGVNNAQ